MLSIYEGGVADAYAMVQLVPAASGWVQLAGGRC